MKHSLSSFVLLMILSIAACGQEESINQHVIAPDIDSDAAFGEAIALYDNYLFVGAPGASGTGRVTVYANVDTSWTNSGDLETLYRDSGMAFGGSLAADKNMVIVGAYNADRGEKDAGIAMIFEADEEGVWTETAQLFPDTIVWNAWFGSSVDISGDIAVIGALFGQTGNEVTGAAYIFRRDDDGSWKQTARLQPSKLNADDRFGSSVAISGNTVVVGSPKDDENGEDAGAVFIFEQQANKTWKHITKLNPAGNGDLYGSAVDISDDQIIVGAPWYQYRGGAFLYQKTEDGSWEKTAILKPGSGSSTKVKNIHFGHSVSIKQTRAVVGAPYIESNVWLFEKENGTWGEGLKLTMPDSTFNNSLFGLTVGLSTDQVAVGAPEYSDSRGAVMMIDR